MCDVGGIFVQGCMPIVSMGITVFLVTLLIALGPFEASILVYLSHMCT